MPHNYRPIIHGQDSWRVDDANQIEGIRAPTGNPDEDVLLARWADSEGTALVRPGGQTVSIVAGIGLWANRPVTGTLYHQYFATDIGPSGTMFWWNGTRWKVLYASVLAENAPGLVGTAQQADQYLGGLGPFPIGLILPGDVISYQFGLAKNGTVDNYGTVSIRLGTAKAIGDSAILTANLVGTITSSVDGGTGFDKWIRFESNTTTRGLGPNNASPSWNGLSTTGANWDVTAPIPNLTTNAWNIGISTTMTGVPTPATVVDSPVLTYQRLTLMP